MPRPIAWRVADTGTAHLDLGGRYACGGFYKPNETVAPSYPSLCGRCSRNKSAGKAMTQAAIDEIDAARFKVASEKTDRLRSARALLCEAHEGRVKKVRVLAPGLELRLYSFDGDFAELGVVAVDVESLLRTLERLHGDS